MSILHNSKGYVFEIKKNPSSIQRLNFSGISTPLYGVKETYQSIFNGSTNVTSVSLVCGVDMVFKLSVPAFFNASLGLSSLNRLVQSKETVYQDLQKFSRSHKAVYSVNPLIICSFNGKFDNNSGQWIKDKTRLEYFMQTDIGKENIDGELHDVVYGSLITPNMATNNPANRGNEMACLINRLNYELLPQMEFSLSSKEDFWLARLGG